MSLILAQRRSVFCCKLTGLLFCIVIAQMLPIFNVYVLYTVPIKYPRFVDIQKKSCDIISRLIMSVFCRVLVGHLEKKKTTRKYPDIRGK